MRSNRRFTLLTGSAFLLIAIVVFWPGIKGGFVSDMYGFLEFAKHSSFREVLQKLKPTPDYFYRPLYFAIFWLLYPVIGENALLYHLISFSGHLFSTLLLYHISFHLSLRREAAAVCALVFLLSLHAHESVFEVSQIHFSLGSCFFLGSILSYMKARNVFSLILAFLTLFLFEAGVLIFPLACLYELLFRLKQPGGGLGSFKRLLPFLILTSAYLLFRFAAGEIYSEAGGCRAVKCLIIGLAEYLNRLFVRPESAIALIWSHRILIAGATFSILLFTLVLLRPLSWRNWRALTFAFGWLAGSVLYFVVALWPYVSDRFLYLPDMGLALSLGCIAAEILAGWKDAPRKARIAAFSVSVLFLIWLSIGAFSIHERGKRWSQAAILAERIVDNIYEQQPELPSGATVCVLGLPDSLNPQIPPANTGPYVFRNNFPSALYRRYGRRDFFVASECRKGYVFTIAPDGDVASSLTTR